MSCCHEEISTNEAVVCRLCGLVLDQLYVYPAQPQESPSVQHDLYEICTKLQTPYYSAIEGTFNSLTHFRIPRDYLMGSAIYSTLNALGCSFDLEKICYLCNISSKRLWKYMNFLGVDDTFSFAFAEQFLQELSLPYSAITQIRVVAEKVLGAYSPRTILASLCYIYLRNTDRKISLPKLTKLLGVSQMSCYRCLKSIRKNATSSQREIFTEWKRIGKPVWVDAKEGPAHG